MKYNDNGLWKTLNVKVTDTLPVGTIIPYAGTTIPSNYMKCEGQELSRIEYDILFSAIGTTYGEGDGSTTFNLPNLKGRVITGIDSNDTAFDTLGETGGEKTHTLTVEEMPSHSHSYYSSTSTSDWPSRIPTGSNAGVDTRDDAIQPTGGGEAHNNLQPYIVLNYIIKVLDAPAIQAQVVNGYSTSSRDSYSCNYVNTAMIDEYSSDEVKTNKVWIDGRPIYRKVFDRGNSLESFAHNISNIANIWINNDYSVRIHATGNCIPLNGGTSSASLKTSCYVNSTTVEINVIDSGTSPAQVYVTLEYTKTTD